MDGRPGGAGVPGVSTLQTFGRRPWEAWEDEIVRRLYYSAPRGKRATACVDFLPERTKSAITSRADSLKNRKAYLHQQVISFLEDAGRKGWHMRPDEATRDMVSAGLRVTHAPIPIYRAMVAAAPEFEVDE